MRAKILDKMIERQINNYKECYNLINLFYKDRVRLFETLEMTEEVIVQYFTKEREAFRRTFHFLPRESFLY